MAGSPKGHRSCVCRLPVATPGTGTDRADGGSVCFAKCDSAWCNDRGSAFVGNDGRCRCTCFTALGWVGQRCDECGGPQPFFPVHSSGGEIVNCTLCTNAGHCSGHAKNVTANATRPGCDCSCLEGYDGRDCSHCASGFNRSDSNRCQQRHPSCMVEPSRGDPLGATVTCAANGSVDPGVSCTWIRKEGYVCSPNLQTSVCGDTSFGMPPYCRHSCTGLSAHRCVASDTPWCHLVRTDEDVECVTNWCTYRNNNDHPQQSDTHRAGVPQRPGNSSNTTNPSHNTKSRASPGCARPASGEPSGNMQCTESLVVHYKCITRRAGGCMLTVPPSTRYAVTEEVLVILSAVAAVGFVAYNYHKYRKYYSKPVYCFPYDWYHVVTDTLAACMVVSDMLLDMKACVQAARYDALAKRRPVVSSAMIAIVAVSHAGRIALAAWRGWKESASHAEAAKRAAVLAVLGPLEEMRNTVRTVMQLVCDGVETETNVDLRRRLLHLGLQELPESLLGLAVQIYFIHDLRSHEEREGSASLVMGDADYAFLFGSPCMAVVTIVKTVTNWAAIECGRSKARGVAAPGSGGRPPELSAEALLGTLNRGGHGAVARQALMRVARGVA
eukprot:gene19400-biopygen29740